MRIDCWNVFCCRLKKCCLSVFSQSRKAINVKLLEYKASGNHNPDFSLWISAWTSFTASASLMLLPPLPKFLIRKEATFCPKRQSLKRKRDCLTSRQRIDNLDGVQLDTSLRWIFFLLKARARPYWWNDKMKYLQCDLYVGVTLFSCRLKDKAFFTRSGSLVYGSGP